MEKTGGPMLWRRGGQVSRGGVFLGVLGGGWPGEVLRQECSSAGYGVRAAGLLLGSCQPNFI